MDVNSIVNNNLDNMAQTRGPDRRSETNRSTPEVLLEKPDIELTEESLDHIVDTLNSAAKSINQRVSFSFHKETQRVIMKVMDASTNEVIRELPPKEVIRFLEKMHELIGVFVDESR